MSAERVLLAFILKSGLKQYFTARRMWPHADVGFVDGPEYHGPVKEYDKVILVDSNVVSGLTVLKASSVISKIFPSSEIKIAAHPRTEFAPVDYPLPDCTMSPKRIVFVSGYSACGKTGFSRGLADALGARLIRWGKLVRSVCDTGRYGEKVPDDPYWLPNAVIDEIAAVVERAGKYTVIDGVKRLEQMMFISYVLNVPAVIVFAEANAELRRRISRIRSEPDDIFFEERDAYFSSWLEVIRPLAHTVKLDSITVPAERLFDALGVRPEIRGRFNPFVTKENLLREYVKVCTRVAPQVYETDVPLHTGYSRRYGLSGNLADGVNLLATSLRIIDDILDEHTVRWVSETGETFEAYWYRRGILSAVVKAVELAATAKAYLGLDFSRYLKLMEVGVMRELELERTGKAPTADDWLISALREVAFRAYLADLLSMDRELAVVEGLYAQAKDDVLGKEKGGRENTDDRLNRPTYDRVFGEDYEWIRGAPLEEVLEMLGAGKEVRMVYDQLVLSPNTPRVLVF